MSQKQDSDQEPSIEEILDSIRQIISDDEEEETPVPESATDDDSSDDDSSDDDHAFDASQIMQALQDNDNAQDHNDDNDDEEEEADIYAADTTTFSAEDEEDENDFDDEIIELTNVVDPQTVDEHIEIDLQESAQVDTPPAKEESKPMPEAIAEKPAATQADIDDDAILNTIITDNAARVARQAFAELAQKAAVDKTGTVTVEDIVRQEIRPILRSWVDKHLPKIMERLLQEELEKIAKRAMEE